MSTAGLITMIISITAVIVTAVWSYYKVFATPNEEDKMHSPNAPLPEDEETPYSTIHHE